ncbi:MAG: HAD family hydrolase [Eubacteriales bacterium]
MIKAVLFDMDGVLIDSEELMRECTKKALAEFGAIVSDDDLRELMGTGDEVYIGGAAERQGVRYVPEMCERVYEVYGENITSAYQCPGAGEAIRFVKEHGLGCAICTSATPGKLVHNMRALGYKESDFGAVLTAVDVPQAKPFPYVYLEGARRLGVPIGDCVAFDDTINGVKAGLSSGAFTVAVGTTFAEEDFLAAGLKPDGYIRGIDELPEFFASRFPEQFGKLS